VNPSSSPDRDLRLDWFRGLALLCIFIDHVPGDRLAAYTLRNLGLSDASELFVFISAYSAGLVYTARAERAGLASAGRRVWQRAAYLYGAHILLLVLVCVLAGWLTRTLHDPQFVNGLNVAPFLARPGETFLAALTFAFQPTFVNILPLYIVLLAFFPLMLLLVRRSQLLALGISVALYMAAREWPTWLDNPFGAAWEFNPLAWQLLFVIGVSLGASATEGRAPIPRSRVLFALAAVYAMWALLAGHGVGAWAYDANANALSGPLAVLAFPVFDRVNLSLWRLADLLALTYLVTWFLRADSPMLRWRASRPLILLGQHSLPVFCVGVLLSILGWATFVALGETLPAQVLVNVGGGAMLVAVAWLLSVRARAMRSPQVSTDRIDVTEPV
jgi:hypothetical protein